jgi:hypothetical protein
LNDTGLDAHHTATAPRSNHACEAIAKGRKMSRYSKNRQVNFEIPAPVAVCGVLLAAALTKGGHSGWAIGGLICLYTLYLTMQYSKRGADVGELPLGADRLPRAPFTESQAAAPSWVRDASARPPAAAELAQAA